MPNAPAARITDQVKHTEAMSFRRIGAGIGGVLGFAAGCALVGLALVSEVVTAGMATPLVAVAVYVGAGLVVAGSTAGAASMFSNQGAHIGANVPGNDEGPIITGIDSIKIGTDKQSAAYLGSKVRCDRHKHDPPDAVEFVVQGSKTVRFGSGHYPAARVGDKGTCDFKIGHGCDTVIIGGETITRGKIDLSGDDPEAAFFNKLGEYGGAAFLAGTALLAIPAGFVAGGAWGAVRAAVWAGVKFEASSKVIGLGINHLVPAGPLRDTANSFASILPLFHGGAEAGGEESSGGTDSEGGKPESEGGKPDADGDSATGPEDTKPSADSTGAEDTSPKSPGSEAPSPERGGPAESGSEEAGSEADPTRPIGDSPGGLRGGEEAESDADAGDEKAEAPAEEPPAEDNIYRKDRAPDTSEGRKPGSRKSFINEDGDLEPANPEGDATVQQHVRGSEPAKSDSPYTSFSDQLGTSKDYGGDLITLDRGSLSQDIASGKVSGVDILNHEDVLAAHDGYVADAQARYDANPTAKNMERLNRAQQDRSNSERDREVLIKGTVPGEYITRTPAEPPADSPSPDDGGKGPDGVSDDSPPTDAPPKDAASGEPAGDPLVQIGPRDGGMPGEAPTEQAEDGSRTEQGDTKAAAGESDPTVQPGDRLGGMDEAKVEAPEEAVEDPEMAQVMHTYEALGDEPPKVDLTKNDAAYRDAHTLERHGPDIPLERSSAPVGDRTIEGRIYGDTPWRQSGENYSYKWNDVSTMNRTVNDYLQNNWEQVRSDLALEGTHSATFNTGHAVGEGYSNSGMYGNGPVNAVYGQTSMVTTTIDAVPGNPSAINIVRAFPNGRGY